MNGAPDSHLSSRRVLLRQVSALAVGAMATSVLAACGPAAAPAPTSAPAAALRGEKVTCVSPLKQRRAFMSVQRHRRSSSRCCPGTMRSCWRSGSYS